MTVMFHLCVVPVVFCSLGFVLFLPPCVILCRPEFTNHLLNHPNHLPTTSSAADHSHDLLPPPTLASLVSSWFPGSASTNHTPLLLYKRAASSSVQTLSPTSAAWLIVCAKSPLKALSLFAIFWHVCMPCLGTGKKGASIYRHHRLKL